MQKPQLVLSDDRKKILKKIEEYERLGKWDIDVEDDPPTIVLEPNKIDYLNKKLSSKIACKFSNYIAIKYFDGEIKKGNLVIKKVVGMENYKKIENIGCVITCNHFSVYDNYIIYKTLQKDLNKQKKQLWKVIREGNYTSLKGLFGFFMRHCNTLPLSSNLDTMKKFMSSVNTLLKRKEKILIYPEQAMWWNYKKPRPLKTGAFKIACSSMSPILPCFITMEDSDKIAPDGSFVQEHTLHILEPIFPDPNKTTRENAKEMMEQNYKAWVELYEKTYNKKLEYLS